MMNNWTDQLANLRTGAKALAQANPPWSRPTPGSTGRWARPGPGRQDPGAHRTGRRGDDPLRWLHCSHAAAARQAGASQQEVAEALGTAIALNAGAAYVYSARALEAYNQFEQA